MVEIWVGLEKFDYDESVECQFSVTDFRSLGSGNLNTSYDIDIPHTNNNIKILKYCNTISSTEELSSIASIIVDGIEIIKGKLLIVDIQKNYTKIIISASNWSEDYSDKKLTDLDLSAYNETYNSTNVVASWTNSTGCFVRYPLVSFGKTDHGIGSYLDDEFRASDFVQWFNVKKIIEKIFAGKTIISTFFETDYFKNQYISAYEPIAQNEFLDNRGLDVKATDVASNLQEKEIAGSAYYTLTTALNVFDGVITDEGADFSTIDYKYIVPITGTYRFTLAAKVNKDYPSPWFVSGSYDYKIIKTPLIGADVTLVREQSATVPVDKNMDTGYIHLIAGEKLYCTMYLSVYLHNTSAVSEVVSLGVDPNTELKSIINDRCLLQGIGITVEPSKYLPNWTQLDFVEAVKKVFNLVYWYDKNNNAIHVEPQPTFVTSNIKDISNLIDYAEIEQELISSNYCSKILLEFTNDEKDVVLDGYNKSNENTKGYKYIELTSVYADKGIQSFNTKFSTFIKSLYNSAITPSVPRIYGDYDTTLYFYPQYRLAQFNIKFGEWKGYNSTGGYDWKYESTIKTSYPQIDALDFNTLYPLYFSKTFHMIDKGKIVKINGITDKLFVSELTTVINNASNEGFRVLYKFLYQGEYHYGILNNYNTNENRCIYELTLII